MIIGNRQTLLSPAIQETQSMNNQFLTVPLELKALTGRKITGHGSIFGNVDLGGDVVLPGAFRASLAEHDKNGTMPQCFWMHQWDQIPGVWDSMREDDIGLAVAGTLADTALGNEIRTLAKMKAVRGLSIGYFPTDTDYAADGVRLIKSVDLVEVSYVSLAMNPLAEIEAIKCRLSAAGEYVPTKREFERKLRDVGLAQSIAKKLVSAAFGGQSQRDVDDAELAGIAAILELCGKVQNEMELTAIQNLTSNWGK